jgi:hypothetical protein
MAISTEISYYLILVDLQGSTHLGPSEFRALTDRLGAALESLSGRHSDSLALPVRQQYGDEVAALLQRPYPIYDIADEIREAAYPTAQVRIVVTRGHVGQAASELPLLGGPVFQRAQEKMTALKRRREPALWDIGPPHEQGVLQALFNLTHSIASGLTDYQRETWRLLRTGVSQQEIAARLKKKPQSVSRAVATGRIPYLIEGEEALRSVLRHLPEEDG